VSTASTLPAALSSGASATARVEVAYADLARGERPEAWIAVRARAEVLAEATAIDARVRTGAALPLAGTVFAVKDNIDVAGLPTTAGCPSFGYRPRESAPAVTRLTAAGAIVIGKTNMDQFATGLVGTRSPYGAVRDARDPRRISGGSSSGSAVAVALGTVDFALGTDTAGSGRVPAALQGIVGIKPTLGLVPGLGVVPAARSYDTVSVLAPTLSLAEVVTAVLCGPHPNDPRSRSWPADAPLAARRRPRVGVPSSDQLVNLCAARIGRFAQTTQLLVEGGAELVAVDVSPFLAAAELLYGGALVAERYAAVGAFLDTTPDDADPIVAAIIGGARDIPAAAMVTDLQRLDEFRLSAREMFAHVDALLLPTTTEHPTIAQVLADPIGVNDRLGTYTNFANLLDLAGVAVPAGQVEGTHFGVTVLVPAFHDRVAADVARLLSPPDPHQPPAEVVVGAQPALPLVVVGAHMSEQPLNDQLTEPGARRVGWVSTAAEYRLYALPTTPPKPGLVHTPGRGAAIRGEKWLLPPAGLGTFLASLPPPLALGPVQLSDGDFVTGFLCPAAAAETGTDITAHGGWAAFLRTTP